MNQLTDEAKTVLLVSNRRLTENAGRAEKFETRSKLLSDRGWELRVGYVEPTPIGLARSLPRLIRMANEADVINSVSNPPHLQIGGAIASAVTKKPWVAEFRDPLVENPDVETDSFAKRLRRRLEQYILEHAEQVIWYDGIQIPDEYFEHEYPEVPTQRCRRLPPIGFEQTKFDAATPKSFDTFTVTYAGSFYEGWIEPFTFLGGLGEYVDKRGSGDIQALFYGDWDPSYERVVLEQGLGDVVDPRPFIPHEEIVSVLKGSDVLLYIGGDDPRNARNLPSKLYDYIGARRPIIAVVDSEFRVADLIREHEFGIVVEPGDRDGVRAALERIRSGEFEYAPDESVFHKFTRERSNDAYVDTLESVITT